MRITVDTSHDSHDDIRKVIKMLQHLVGDSGVIFSNQPQDTATSPMANIFGDVSAQPQATPSEITQEAQQETAEAQNEEASENTEDLFAELFSEEELKKMDVKKDEEEKINPKKKKYDIELY